MQIKSLDNPVERIGVTGETKFNIEHNAKAFEILSSGLYTDPIMAVVRELSCNAYDAMTEAGKGKDPIIVHLPCKLEPYFSVKDNGIGMSDKDVRGLYSTYFASTKSDSNDQIGAFGLGSKSPFSYSKAFDVISRWEGTKRTYSVFVNEEGVPTIAELAKVKTKECNGIEVKIAAREHDYHSFQDRVASVLQHFPIQPTVLGRTGFEFDKPAESATITDDYIVDKTGSGLVIVQGNVPYKANENQLSFDGAVNNFVNNHRIVLFFDIGMIDVAANREEVRYDEETVKNINAAVAKAHNDYLELINEELNELTKGGNRYDVYVKLDEKFGSVHQLLRLAGKYKFDSKMVNEWVVDDGTIEYTLEWKYHKIVPYMYGNDRAIKTKHNTSGYGSSLSYQLMPRADARIVYHDITKRGSLRMNTILTGGRWSSSNNLLAIIPITDRMLGKDGVTVTARQRTIEKNKIIKMMGNPTVPLLSAITQDVVPEHKRERKTGHTYKMYVQDLFSRNRRAKPEFVDVPEPTEDSLYIEIDHLRNLIIGEKKIGWTKSALADAVDKILIIINQVNGTKYDTKSIFGLTKTVVKAVKDKSKWKSLAELYGESLEEIKEVIEFHSRINNTKAHGIGYVVHKKYFADMVTSLPKASKFRKAVEPIVEIAKAARDFRVKTNIGRYEFQNLNSYNRIYGIEIEVKTNSYFKDGSFKDYNMISHLDLDQSVVMEDLKAYIKLVEKKK